MAKLLGLITEAMPILHQNKFFVPQIRSTHLLALNQLVPGRQTKKKFFGEELLDLNPRIARGLADESEIKLIFFQRSQELLRRILVKRQADRGIFFSERIDNLRQKIRGDSRQCPKEDLSSELSAHLSNFLLSYPGSFQDAHSMRQEERPGRREERFALSSLKEPLTDFFLELYDLLTQRGLCDAALSCCPAETSVPGNGSKIAQLTHLHSFSLYLVRGIKYFQPISIWVAWGVW
jgi:hypothetical protein